jgi:hypothetical protein
MQPEEPTRPDPVAALERAFIAEFLERRGYTLEALQRLPAAEAHDLMKQASVYASGRLSEVESRAHLVHDLHHAANPESD